MSTTPRDNTWLIPDLTPMQEILNENARLMAAERYAFPQVFMAGIEGTPLADQEIPAEGTE